jgi:hypothetical protein
MVDRDAFADRGRSFEEEYFRKKDLELIEKMRLAAAEDGAQSALGQASGVSDPELLRELRELGFTPETVRLLPLLPVLQVAWAEGGVSTAERDLLVRLARSRGVTEGSAADQQLAAWLAAAPPESVFSRGTRLIRAMLESTAVTTDLSADDLVGYCEQIAAASGGMLGIGRVSSEERALITRIASEVKGRA